jgi:hypothetical protein
MRSIKEIVEGTTITTHYQAPDEVIDPLLLEIHENKAENPNGFSPSKNYRFLGTIPMIAIEDVLTKEGINMMGHRPHEIKRAKQWLNDNYKFKGVDKRILS